MNILVTNDDGISAEGLWALAEELSKVGKVYVVAPDREHSGVGASVTLNNPVRLLPVKSQVPGIESYAVEGTPADSVILALNRVVAGKVDLLVAGVNQGPNMGNDVLISGTVGAALQGHFSGIPSIALSVAAMEAIRLEAATTLARLLATRVASSELPGEMLLNINLPNLPTEEIKGIEITRTARRSYLDAVEEGHDRKRKYYWIVRGATRWLDEDGTDVRALNQNKISITPLTANLTYEAQFPSLSKMCPWLLGQLSQGQQRMLPASG